MIDCCLQKQLHTELEQKLRGGGGGPEKNARNLATTGCLQLQLLHVVCSEHYSKSSMNIDEGGSKFNRGLDERIKNLKI
jgi:hypothetical protein